MIIKIRKFVATVSMYNEDENGNISKETKEITLAGKRFTAASVLNKIPREAKVENFGWRETAYEIDADILEKFLAEHGTPAECEKD